MCASNNICCKRDLQRSRHRLAQPGEVSATITSPQYMPAELIQCMYNVASSSQRDLGPPASRRFSCLLLIPDPQYSPPDTPTCKSQMPLLSCVGLQGPCKTATYFEGILAVACLVNYSRPTEHLARPTGRHHNPSLEPRDVSLYAQNVILEPRNVIL